MASILPVGRGRRRTPDFGPVTLAQRQVHALGKTVACLQCCQYRWVGSLAFGAAGGFRSASPEAQEAREAREAREDQADPQDPAVHGDPAARDSSCSTGLVQEGSLGRDLASHQVVGRETCQGAQEDRCLEVPSQHEVVASPHSIRTQGLVGGRLGRQLVVHFLAGLEPSNPIR
jgi:hypothetical protein